MGRGATPRRRTRAARTGLGAIACVLTTVAVAAPAVAQAPAVGLDAAKAIERVAEPVAKRVQPELEQAVQPAADTADTAGTAAAEPIVEQTVEPVAKAAEPVVGRTVEPASKAIEPVTKAAGPVVGKTIEPVTKAIEPVTKAADPVVRLSAPAVRLTDAVGRDVVRDVAGSGDSGVPASLTGRFGGGDGTTPGGRSHDSGFAGPAPLKPGAAPWHAPAGGPPTSSPAAPTAGTPMDGVRTTGAHVRPSEPTGHVTPSGPRAGRRAPDALASPAYPVAPADLLPQRSAALGAAMAPHELAAPPLELAGTASPDRPAPAPSAPSGTAAASAAAGSSAAPMLALVALLLLAAPSLSRFLRTVPAFLRPTPFICALERPG